MIYDSKQGHGNSKGRAPVENREGRRRCPRCRTLYREGERHGCSPLSESVER